MICERLAADVLLVQPIAPGDVAESSPAHPRGAITTSLARRRRTWWTCPRRTGQARGQERRTPSDVVIPAWCGEMAATYFLLGEGARIASTAFDAWLVKPQRHRRASRPSGVSTRRRCSGADWSAHPSLWMPAGRPPVARRCESR
jgi:hypothetical protein